MNELIKLILQYEFWDKNQHKILREMFPDSLYDLYNLIIKTHIKLQRDLNIAELKALYRAEHPTATIAKLDLVFQILDTLPDIGNDIAQEVLEKAWITEMGRQITQVGIDIVNGQGANFEKAKTLILKMEQGELSTRDELDAVSSELEEILDAINITTKWPFNLPSLATVCSGVGPGIFTIIAGRPESGKSALGISLVAAPGGFADQGALVHYYANEEAGIRLQGRAVMSYTGMPLLDILNNKEQVRKKYLKIKDKLKFFDCRDKDISQINAHVTKHKPDITIIDQTDKLSMNGNFAREDERLGILYAEQRNICARTNSASFALTQLNADAEGKNYISSANLSNARTAKAAEGDVVLGIGRSPIHEENVRIINVIKNKILGRHDEIVCVLHPLISRYTQ